MGKLGLEQLSDEQAYELWLEMAEDMVQRDPLVRRLAQAAVVSAAERLAIKRQLQKEVTSQCAAEYVLELRAATLIEVRAEVGSGKMRLLTSGQEARVVVDATYEAKIKLLEETMAAIQSGKHRAIEPIRQPDYNPGIEPEYNSATQIRAEARRVEEMCQRRAAEEYQRMQMQQIRISPPIRILKKGPPGGIW